MDGFQPQALRRESAPEQIADQIRDAILTGRLMVGERLPPEHDLATSYGVSRPTIREAMRILASSRLIEATRGAAGGTFVALPSPDVVAEALSQTIELWFQTGSTSAAEVDHARGWIERGCVRLAATNRTNAEADAIQAAVDAAADPELDTDSFLTLDLEFHVAISRAAHNAILELAMTAIHLVRPRTNTLLIAALDNAAILEQHQAIATAIRDQQPDAAERAFLIHFEHLMAVQAQALADTSATDIQVRSIVETHPAISALNSRAPHPDATQP